MLYRNIYNLNGDVDDYISKTFDLFFLKAMSSIVLTIIWFESSWSTSTTSIAAQ